MCDCSKHFRVQDEFRADRIWPVDMTAGASDLASAIVAGLAAAAAVLHTSSDPDLRQQAVLYEQEACALAEWAFLPEFQGQYRQVNTEKMLQLRAFLPSSRCGTVHDSPATTVLLHPPQCCDLGLACASTGQALPDVCLLLQPPGRRGLGKSMAIRGDRR